MIAPVFRFFLTLLFACQLTLQPTHAIISNKIHPFFVQVPQKPHLLHLASTGTDNAVPPSSEGHHYQGPIANGHWVDASNLKAGYRLLNDDESWAEVVSVNIEKKALKAYNLTVADFHTYFVRGAHNDNAEAVWVHNNCPDAPNRGVSFSTTQLDKKFKHASDFGVVTTKKNPTTLTQHEAAIKSHLGAPKTVQQGTYGFVKDSKVHFNPTTNNAVVVDKSGNFVTGFKLTPGTPQYTKYINDGLLR